ncbi:hypothetical protein AX769_10555 [Frondihabitans sp. PAMC 28766]|uniref:hypothetical protein n=1 Tax=Frondihabitans sp. PAMC 28766 TaxID=1795630 RepID=UPI00078BD627|nr:hypothetical protein [Frondihabitans sp. PAMC 28766]AMM20507.1 hypothetical protein AX769_10555 [Frondihabitans sp. PAMC 28766]
MTERDETAAEKRAKGKDVDGLKTLPGVHSATGDEKAGTGDDETEGDDPADAHVASETYPSHPAPGGPPNRHH